MKLSYSHDAGTGFSADEGASLLVAFRGLQAETAAQGQIHLNIAKELESLVAEPFDNWAQSYKVRFHPCLRHGNVVLHAC